MPTVAVKFRFLSTASPWIASTAAALSTSLQCVVAESDYTVSCMAVESSYSVSCMAVESSYAVSCVAVDSHGLYVPT